MSERLLIFDYDNIIYKAGFATETRSVLVKHLNSGTSKEFKNKTEFYGNKKKEIGGWLGELNAERIVKGLHPFERDEFEFETIRSSEPLEYVLFTVKAMINNICEELNCFNYKGYIGKGESFRVERSTLLKYKGNREDALRPLMKDEITEYLVNHHNAEIIEGIEADDKCIMEAMKHNAILVGIDKDSLGHPVMSYNPDHPEWGIIDGNCFGELQLLEKVNSKGVKTKDVKGYGRKFFYYQLVFGDDVDNYRANCASEKDWGPVSAYNALNECRTDKECFEAIKNVYKILYPEPIEVIGWRGNTLRVDWKYVLSEVWDLARMRRHDNDIVTAEEVFKKYGLWEN